MAATERPPIKSPTPAKWDVFIAHASEDKDDIVRPLFEELRRRGLRVWYDEFEIKVGDSLREKIDEGLAESHHGIVVISEHFFEKSWAKDELAGLVALEEGSRRRILPVWHRTSKEEVRKRSPTLADRRAARADQPVSDLADELIAAMEVELTSSEPLPPAQQLSLSPPPAQIELRNVLTGAVLVDGLLGAMESTFDFDAISDPAKRTEVAESLDSLRDSVEIWQELSLRDREELKRHAREFVTELTESDLLPQLGEYERRLVGLDGTSSAWRGVVVRVAPAAEIAAAQAQRRNVRPPRAGDQAILEELLGLLTRPSMRLLRQEDFAAPWRERAKTPLRFLVHVYDEVEHRFDDPELEAARQRLMQSANHFLHQEAMNGFANNFDHRLRDAGYTPAEAEGDSKREELIERRGKAILKAATEFLDAYDELIELARGRGYSLEAMKAERHPRVVEFDKGLQL